MYKDVGGMWDNHMPSQVKYKVQCRCFVRCSHQGQM